MDLETWFKEEVGLQGKRMELALEMCENNEVKSQDELREVSELGKLGVIFSNGVIVAFVEAALEREAAAALGKAPKGTAVKKEKHKREDTKAETRSNASKGPPQGTDLPPYKEFAAFISHKKVSKMRIDFCLSRSLRYPFSF